MPCNLHCAPHNRQYPPENYQSPDVDMCIVYRNQNWVEVYISYILFILYMNNIFFKDKLVCFAFYMVNVWYRFESPLSEFSYLKIHISKLINILLLEAILICLLTLTLLNRTKSYRGYLQKQDPCGVAQSPAPIYRHGRACLNNLHGLQLGTLA